MRTDSGRRRFLTQALSGMAVLGAQAAFGKGRQEAETAAGSAAATSAPPPFKLGLVTYNLARDWDIKTIFQNCEATGFEAVELRTTHRHGVEIALGKGQRAEVRKRFAGSAVRLLSLGTTCEYHDPEPVAVEQNIAETLRWCELAKDLGCLGVKVRPNGLPAYVPEEKTLEQIGQALRRCGDAAREAGVELWVEVHGPGTQEAGRMRRIMEIADHPSVGVCWNSNDTDVVNGSVREAFEMLRPWLRSCHINELWRAPAPWGGSAGRPPEEVTPGFPSYAKPYPYRELFGLLRRTGYDRYTLAEIPESPEPLRLMRYYRALWEQLAS
jgi:sugar phosphate isomerase/epimerase